MARYVQHISRQGLKLKVLVEFDKTWEVESPIRGDDPWLVYKVEYTEIPPEKTKVTGLSVNEVGNLVMNRTDLIASRYSWAGRNGFSLVVKRAGECLSDDEVVVVEKVES